METKKLTPRTRIEYRLTTTPADFGYNGQPTGWLEGKPLLVGTPGTILDRAYAEIRKCGEGVYHAEQFRLRDGTVVSRHEIEEYVYDIDMSKYRR